VILVVQVIREAAAAVVAAAAAAVEEAGADMSERSERIINSVFGSCVAERSGAAA
jgi:hypothetical protein